MWGPQSIAFSWFITTISLGFKVVGGPTLWLTYSATHLGEPDSTKNKDGITKNGPLNFRPDRFSTQVFEVVFCLMPFSIFFFFPAF